MSVVTGPHVCKHTALTRPAEAIPDMPLGRGWKVSLSAPFWWGNATCNAPCWTANNGFSDTFLPCQMALTPRPLASESTCDESSNGEEINHGEAILSQRMLCTAPALPITTYLHRKYQPSSIHFLLIYIGRKINKLIKVGLLCPHVVVL